MLNGIRKKIKKEFEEKEKQKIQENVQYNSSEKYRGLEFLKKQKNNQKSTFLKNKYKYKEMRSKQMGKYKDGALTFSKSEINKISS